MPSLTIDLAFPARLLVLIGGGEFSFGETREIDAFLIRALAPERRSVAFLPTASGSAEYATHFGAYLAAIDPPVQTVNVPVYRGRDARRRKHLDSIREAGMVYVGGGVTNTLLGTLRESPAEEAMRQAATEGTIVAAIGAAAACFGAHARDMRGVASSVPALGWLRNTVVETAIDTAGDDMLRRMMSLPDVSMGIGIPTGTALAIRADGSTEVVGPGQIVTFRKK